MPVGAEICSFCGSEFPEGSLVEGPQKAFICSDCVVRAHIILTWNRRHRRLGVPASPWASGWLILLLGAFITLCLAAPCDLTLSRLIGSSCVFLISGLLLIYLPAEIQKRRFMDQMKRHWTLKCHACGYNLAGSPERCPECGEPRRVPPCPPIG